MARRETRVTVDEGLPVRGRPEDVLRVIVEPHRKFENGSRDLHAGEPPVHRRWMPIHWREIDRGGPVLDRGEQERRRDERRALPATTDSRQKKRKSPRREHAEREMKQHHAACGNADRAEEEPEGLEQ